MSRLGANFLVWGLLFFYAVGIAEADPPAPTVRAKRTIVVLFTSKDDLELRSFAAPDGACQFHDLESFDLEQPYPAAATLVLTGHSVPPIHYLNQSAERLAEVIACFKPDLVVADTCYGFSSPLLTALAKRNLTPIVVGPAEKLPGQGLCYEPDFFRQVSTARRAQAVRKRSESAPKLMQWRIDAADLEKVLADVNRWSPKRLTKALKRVHPNLVKVPLFGATMLVPVEPVRFRKQVVD